jgi:pimeloyl-ACP methyl ester carboxylesterase
VGFRFVEQFDHSRVYRHLTDEFGIPREGERARPLQTAIWYPAEPGGTSVMTVGDYLNLWATETSFGLPKMPASANEWLAAMSPTLTMPLWAIRDAQPAAGCFPVVIYAPGCSNPSWDNADLCEYLASHGYLVVASPSLGTNSREMTMDLAGINSQARDISFLIGYAGTLPNAASSSVAVVGFSWGGISNLVAAARDNRVGALVALDGSLRFSPGLVKHKDNERPRSMMSSSAATPSMTAPMC